MIHQHGATSRSNGTIDILSLIVANVQHEMCLSLRIETEARESAVKNRRVRLGDALDRAGDDNVKESIQTQRLQEWFKTRVVI